MFEFSNNQKVDECLNRLLKAKSGQGSQAIADVEFLQEKLYKVARKHWKDLRKIIVVGKVPKPDLMSDILWALRDITDDEVVNLFREIVASHKDWEARYSAIGALSRLEDIDLIDTFVLALTDSDSSVQFRAVKYIEKYGDSRALFNLKNIIEDEYLKNKCPGLIDSAKRAIARIEE